MDTNHTLTVRIAKSDLAMERVALGDAIERETTLTARVAELEAALRKIADARGPEGRSIARAALAKS